MLVQKSLSHFQPADLRQRYEFIRSVMGGFSIAILFQVLRLSRTAYYHYLRGGSYQPSETKKEQLGAVGEIFWQHKRRYGSRRILADLREQGYASQRLTSRHPFNDFLLEALKIKCLFFFHGLLRS